MRGTFIHLTVMSHGQRVNYVYVPHPFRFHICECGCEFPDISESGYATEVAQQGASVSLAAAAVVGRWFDRTRVGNKWPIDFLFNIVN